jgi:hypothetical protein
MNVELRLVQALRRIGGEAARRVGVSDDYEMKVDRDIRIGARLELLRTRDGRDEQQDAQPDTPGCPAPLLLPPVFRPSIVPAGAVNPAAAPCGT